MKKLIVLLLILVSYTSIAQFHFPENEHFSISATIDPNASIKEKGFCLGAELEYIGCPIYTRGAITIFPQLQGGYLETGGAIGISITEGYWDNLRLYSGVRLGVIHRAGNPYPTAGIEAGLDYTFGDHFTLGGRLHRDLRTDAEFWGGEQYYRNSGTLKIGYRW